MSNFIASQEARLAKFEADFKQKQSKMTNKIDNVLKALNDQGLGALPSDTVKNPKLNVNYISSVSSPSSCLEYYSVNAMSTYFKQTQVFQKDRLKKAN
jgi:predicted transcriptional regulator